MASHGTAAALHGLLGFQRHEFEVQSPTRLQRPGIRTHRTRFAHAVYPAPVRGIPTTSVTRNVKQRHLQLFEERTRPGHADRVEQRLYRPSRVLKNRLA